MAPMIRYGYWDGYKVEIGRPLGLEPDQVDGWLNTTGIPLRLTHQGRAPVKDAVNPGQEWTTLLRQIYRDRQAEASQVDDEATNWARMPWPEAETTTIPDIVQVVLSEVMHHVKNRIRFLTRTGRMVPVPDPTMPGPPVPGMTVPGPAVPRLGMPEPLVAPATTSAAPLVPEVPTGVVSADLASIPSHAFVGLGAVKRDLVLELVECPADWPGETPEALAIDTIFVLIWNQSAQDVPTLAQLHSVIHAQYDPPTAGAYEISLLYRWAKRIGLNAKTGSPARKIHKAIIRTEKDLEMAWIAFARVPITEPIELFFEIRRREPTTA
ncbi:MAG: hypothetical protein M1826_005326 [Phylliscum demangeonii]|nr:MAG: hypothetical protein M1826_005326 [Phylliscum demangeonii]